MNAARTSAILAGRQDAILQRITEAKKAHAKRSHLNDELCRLKIEQLQVECRAFDPTPWISVAAGLCAAIVFILYMAGVI